MYEQFFHLNKRPFSIAPDPGFLYLSQRHRDALAHLKYGLESDGGFVLVTGEVGTGKTTLLRNLIGQVPGDIDVAFILNPRLTVRELLQTICDELGIDYPAEDQHSVKPYIDRLNKHLLRTHQLGRSTVVVIDEAQNLSPAVLEQLRLLTNLETNERKLLRIILVGQPELKAMLARQELRQLNQRVTARYHLQPLQLDDTRAYLAHRLTVSGGNPNLFSGGASWNIHRHAGGIPRLINIIADRAMLGAFADGKPRIDFMTSQKAARETLSNERNVWGWLAVAGAVLITLGGSWMVLDSMDNDRVDNSRAEVSVANDALAPPPPHNAPTTTAVAAPTQNNPAANSAINPVEPYSSAPEPLTEIVVRPAPAATESAPPPTLATGSVPSASSAPPRTITQPPQDLRTTIPPPTLASVTPQPQRPVSSSLRPAAGVPSYQSQRRAFSSMYALWGVTYEPENALVPCDFAPRYQLQCTKRASEWKDVERLNVPVVLRLRGEGNQPFYVTAVNAQAEQVTIDQGGVRTNIDLAVLTAAWDGTIIALWPTPETYRGSIKPGSNGDAVRELRGLLGKAINADLGNSRTFDVQLGNALREFQGASGLLADGIAGPATWLLVHRAAGYDIPQLYGNPG